MRTFLFYLIYYLTNSVVNQVPCHVFRLAWYRRVLGIRLGRGVQLFRGLVLYGNTIRQIHVGDHSIINPDCMFNASDEITIGKNVVIAHRVSLHTADHDVNDPGFRMRTAPIRIEDGAWVASHAIILKGVTIGKGGVVAAGAVVTRSVEPWQIVGGNPARVIGQRKPVEVSFQDARHPLFC